MPLRYQRPEENTEPPENGIQFQFEALCGCWESEPVTTLCTLNCSAISPATLLTSLLIFSVLFSFLISTMRIALLLKESCEF